MNNNQIGNEVTKDDILLYLSTEILMDSIKEQINGTTSSIINYLDTFDDKYYFLVKEINDTDGSNDIMQELIEQRKEFYYNVQKMVCEKFGIIGLDIKDTLTEEEKHIIIDSIYSFFILNNVNNTVSYFYNSIKDNQKSIIKSYKTSTNVKDLYFTMAKKAYGKDNAIILSNVNNFCLNTTVTTIEDYVEYALRDNDTNENRDLIYDIFLSDNILNDISVDMEIFNAEILKLYKDNPSIEILVKANIMNWINEI